MLAKELATINKLDQEIAGMHEHLHALYQKRQQLLSGSLATPFSTDLDAVAAAWQRHGITLPRSTSFKKHFQRAQKLTTSLETSNPDLAGQLTIVAVPPTTQLETALQHVLEAGSHRYDALDSAVYPLTTSRSWEILVVFGLSARIPVFGLQAFLGREAYQVAGHDSRGLGLRELVAAELQGVQVVQPGTWSLLLKDMTDGLVSPCATSNDGSLTLDIEDTNCLLGENYMQPAIAVR